MARCDSCGKNARELTKTMTGRDICPACKNRLDATAVAMMSSSGGDGASASEVIATMGWLERIRKARKKG